ncbi:MAG: hypothetical protein A2939_01615 [Parcubacteria group bacterium RIFCSPLOWO2_01_FULL_48_18]|nr:MAG: hypothetical protein A2939_01615 [Parcubacteria group bacterium RIFCSPLOWO2_01_FULL_48_18]OHB23603.1 MAG: hypothetical protein A3J67_01985 [Parcubacteria group bacterium RIFCSPHIGHO2_02_FULL_48_10b]
MCEIEGGPPRSPEQVEFLTRITNCLSGTYNSKGILEWFFRAREELKGKSPADILFANSDWKPENPEPQLILQLAQSLCGPGDST